LRLMRAESDPTPGSFYAKPNHSGMREILKPCRYETTWLKEGL
jgi:hypothetical protein